MKLNSLDRSHKTASSSGDILRPLPANKCSVQEGVRMMVTPSMFMTGKIFKRTMKLELAQMQNWQIFFSSYTGGPSQDKAILNPPVQVQRAIVVTQENFEPAKSTIISTAASEIKSIVELKDDAGTKPITSEAKQVKNNGGNNWVEQRAISPTHKTLGRQKRIVEPSITPATTPISYASPILIDEAKANTNRSGPANKSFQRITEFGSPESPLSKMNVMLNPLPCGQAKPDTILSPQR